VFASLCFLLPIIGIFISFLMGSGFHVGFLVGMGLFGLMGFYLLRVSLWNTYGSEIIHIENQTITYVANYGWFKDEKQSQEINPIFFTIKQVGYVEDNKGALVIGTGTTSIECATKMSVDDLTELIDKLNARNTL